MFRSEYKKKTNIARFVHVRKIVFPLMIARYAFVTMTRYREEKKKKK